MFSITRSFHAVIWRRWNLTNSTARHLASVVDTYCVIVYMTVSDQQWDTITIHSWIGVCTVCTLGWSWCRGHREWLCCARSYGTRCAEWPGVWQFGCWFRCCYWSCAIGSPETISCNRPKPPSVSWLHRSKCRTSLAWNTCKDTSLKCTRQCAKGSMWRATLSLGNGALQDVDDEVGQSNFNSRWISHRRLECIIDHHRPISNPLLQSFVSVQLHVTRCRFHATTSPQG